MQAIIRVLKNTSDYENGSAAAEIETVAVTSTTDHPASRYHAPVWVDADGNAYGQIDRVSAQITGTIGFVVGKKYMYRLGGARDVFACAMIENGTGYHKPVGGDLEYAVLGDREDLLDGTVLEWF